MSLDGLVRKLVDYTPLNRMGEERLQSSVYPAVEQAFLEAGVDGTLSVALDESTSCKVRVDTLKGVVRKLVDTSNGLENNGDKTRHNLALSSTGYWVADIYSKHREICRLVYGRILRIKVMDDNYRTGVRDCILMAYTQIGIDNPGVFRDKALLHLERARSVWENSDTWNLERQPENGKRDWRAIRVGRAADVYRHLYKATDDKSHCISAYQLICEADFLITSSTPQADIEELDRIKDRVIGDIKHAEV